jgi:hypothetical protein
MIHSTVNEAQRSVSRHFYLNKLQEVFESSLFHEAHKVRLQRLRLVGGDQEI